MLELKTYNQEYNRLNTRDKVDIDMLLDGKKFLLQFDIDHELVQDTVSVVYRYLKRKERVPHNLYKFFIAAYYIMERHPRAFPKHEPKTEFCEMFGIKPSSLDYTVEQIVEVVGFKKILDDKNFPYFLDLDYDVNFKLIKSIIEQKIDAEMMDFLINSQPKNPQFITEDLVTEIVFEMELFPEELFRQFYYIVYEIVEAMDYTGTGEEL
ncbi:MAG: hypothetical protein ACOC4M_13680, partial [Promethearchaeia archaeon]